MKYPGERHSMLESTQTLLKERLGTRPDLPHGYFVLADSQSQGKGRLGKNWESVTGNLQVSILLRQVPLSVPTWIPLWVGTCLHRSLHRLGVPTGALFLKWPNDLLDSNMKKVAGILCEKNSSSVMVGIGANLIQAPLPESAVIPLNPEIGIEAILNELLGLFQEPVTEDQVKEYFQTHSILKTGDLICWTETQTGIEHTARVMDLGEYGELRVEENGMIKPLYSEEVQKIRIS